MPSPASSVGLRPVRSTSGPYTICMNASTKVKIEMLRLISSGVVFSASPSSGRIGA